jgi:hypothetical protein
MITMAPPQLGQSQRGFSGVGMFRVRSALVRSEGCEAKPQKLSPVAVGEEAEVADAKLAQVAAKTAFSYVWDPLIKKSAI